MSSLVSYGCDTPDCGWAWRGFPEFAEAAKATHERVHPGKVVEREYQPLTDSSTGAAKPPLPDGVRDALKTEAAKERATPTRPRTRRWTREEAIAAVRSYYERTGIVPGFLQLTSANGLPSNEVASRLFGGIVPMIEAAGLEPSEAQRRGRTRATSGPAEERQAPARAPERRVKAEVDAGRGNHTPAHVGGASPTPEPEAEANGHRALVEVAELFDAKRAELRDVERRGDELRELLAELKSEILERVNEAA